MGFLGSLYILDLDNLNYKPHSYSESFINDLTSIHDYYPLAQFLLKEELDIVQPNYQEFAQKIDPRLLKNSFEKIYNYLLENKNNLPLIHTIKENNYKDEYSFKFDDTFYKLVGNTKYFEFCEKIAKRNYLKLYAWEKYKFGDANYITWIESEERINIHGNDLTVKTLTMFDKYNKDIIFLIEECDIAIKNNKNVMWIIC